MKTFLAKALLVGTLTLAAGVASASTVNYKDTLNVTANQGESFYGGGGSPINDWFLVKVGGVSGEVSTAIDFSAGNHASSYQLGLFNASNINSLGSIGTATVGAELGQGIGSLKNINLLAGNYLLNVVFGGTDGYVGNISAVPLPGAALLFGSALFGAGALRRKQSVAKNTEMAAA